MFDLDEQAHDYERQIARLKIALKEAREHERQIARLKIALKEAREQRDTWRDLAERQRDMAVECRKKLSETTDAYNKLYDAAVEFINA
jgi:hypothetical protein